MAANKFLNSLFGGSSQGSTSAEQQKKEMSELDRINEEIELVHEAEREQYEQGKKPWEFDLSTVTTSLKKRKKAEAEAKDKADAIEAERVAIQTDYNNSLTKQSEQLRTPEGMKSKIDTSYQTQKQGADNKGFFEEGQDYNWREFYTLNEREAKKGKELIPKNLAGNSLTKIKHNDGSETDEVFVPRVNDRGQSIRILKNEDWIKDQPWAKSFNDPNTGETMFYTTILDLPSDMYIPDKITKNSKIRRRQKKVNFSTQMGVDERTVRAQRYEDQVIYPEEVEAAKVAGVGGFLSTVDATTLPPSVWGTTGPVIPIERENNTPATTPATPPPVVRGSGTASISF